MDFIYKDQIKEEKLMIDLTLSIDELNNELMEEIGILHPFGQENPEPLFCMHKVILSQKPKLVGSGEHFQFSISNGIHLIAGIAYVCQKKIPPINTEIDLAFNLRWNYWNESRKNTNCTIGLEIQQLTLNLFLDESYCFLHRQSLLLGGISVPNSY